MKREDPAVTAMREHMLAHLDSISDADERQALTKELQAYLWRYPFSVEELEGDFVGRAHLDTGEIEIDPSELQRASAPALATYLHEVAHLVCHDGHTVEFATLCAGMQKHFHCHNPASVTYDTHEAPSLDRQSYAMKTLRFNEVKPIADPNAYITHTRAVAARQNWLERQLMPNLVALAVASTALAVLLGWPWIRLFFQNDIATYLAGVGVVAMALAYALFS